MPVEAARQAARTYRDGMDIEAAQPVAGTDLLEPGDVAPDFQLPDADGELVTLSSFRGRSLILYFYPAASTPGCTAQACDFRDSLAEFNGADLQVVGVSPDPPESLARFRDAQGLTFPLLSDPSHSVSAAYGVWGEKVRYGRRTTGLIRSTFVLDSRAIIVAAHYNIRAAGHVGRLRRDLLAVAG